ncbi:MAG: GNAT family N-acetyltransferase [Spirochaetota bacterium]
MAVPVCDPVDPQDIRRELTPDRLVREFRGVCIFSIDGDASPAVMQEVGRIREQEFRSEGGGTGKSSDVDEYDRGPRAFRQLVAWDPVALEIIGMYRYRPAGRALETAEDGSLSYTSPTARLFEFSGEFFRDYLPVAVELGRSVVNRSAKRAVMGLFAVWCGLGAMVAEREDCRYFFGKFTTYPSYHPSARAALLDFLTVHCADSDALMRPLPGLEPTVDAHGELPVFTGIDYDRDFDLLKRAVAQVGETVPPLVISYLGLSRTMRYCGTAINHHFGGVLESAILIRVDDIDARTRSRFVDGHTTPRAGALLW